MHGLFWRIKHNITTTTTTKKQQKKNSRIRISCAHTHYHHIFSNRILFWVGNFGWLYVLICACIPEPWNIFLFCFGTGTVQCLEQNTEYKIELCARHLPRLLVSYSSSFSIDICGMYPKKFFFFFFGKFVWLWMNEWMWKKTTKKNPFFFGFGWLFFSIVWFLDLCFFAQEFGAFSTHMYCLTWRIFSPNVSYSVPVLSLYCAIDSHYWMKKNHDWNIGKKRKTT